MIYKPILQRLNKSYQDFIISALITKTNILYHLFPSIKVKSITYPYQRHQL